MTKTTDKSLPSDMSTDEQNVAGLVLAWESGILAQLANVEDPLGPAAAALKERLASLLVDQRVMAAEETASFIDSAVDLSRQSNPKEDRGDGPYGSFHDHSSKDGRLSTRWLFRRHFFRAVERVAPHVIDDLFDRASDLFADFIQANRNTRYRDSVTWDDDGDTGAEFYLPRAISSQVYAGWPDDDSHTAVRLGGAIREWIDCHNLTAADDAPHWVIESALFNLRRRSKDETSEWMVNPIWAQNGHFGEEPFTFRGWNPQRETRTAWNTWANRAKTQYLDDLEKAAVAMNLKRSPRAPDAKHFDRLIKYQVLGKTVLEILRKKTGNQDLDGLRDRDKLNPLFRQNERLADRLRLKLRPTRTT